MSRMMKLAVIGVSALAFSTSAARADVVISGTISDGPGYVAPAPVYYNQPSYYPVYSGHRRAHDWEYYRQQRLRERWEHERWEREHDRDHWHR